MICPLYRLSDRRFSSHPPPNADPRATMATSLAELPSRSRSSTWRSGEDGWPFAELLATDFKVDRRNAPRWPVAGHASVLGLGSGLGSLVELDELDGAPWWIGGSADAAIKPGTRVTVGFSDPSARSAQGFVMRCEPKGQRFRIAIKFDAASI